jgi:hypothetical protein
LRPQIDHFREKNVRSDTADRSISGFPDRRSRHSGHRRLVGRVAGGVTEVVAGHGSRAAHIEVQAAAVGAVAAAVLLIVAGTVQLLEGISAVAADDIVVVGPQYIYQGNATGWGVVHIVIGALLIAVGVAFLRGRTWARLTAIVLTALSIVANFLWLPHNPWWSVLIIALDVFLIWALATWHRSGPSAPTQW